MNPCLCHGPDYPHELLSESWCCGEADDEPLEMDIARDWLIQQGEEDDRAER